MRLRGTGGLKEKPDSAKGRSKAMKQSTTRRATARAPLKESNVLPKFPNLVQRESGETSERASKPGVRSRARAKPASIIAKAKKLTTKTPLNTIEPSKPTTRAKNTNNKPLGKERAITKAREIQPSERKRKNIVNEAPNKRLKVYVCGDGTSGQLGLGNAKNGTEVTRPRLNTFLRPDTVGVTHLAVGGMHVAALTHDNKILTWGVNDLGALGRDTTWEGGMRDIDQDSDASSGSSDSENESDVNPREATPTAITDSAFPPGTTFAELAAGDSVTFVLTTEGLVYGWGTFRNNEGTLGFDPQTHIQHTPALVPGLQKIKHIACGDNHVLAVDVKGAVFTWGSGQQNQLGRRILERRQLSALIPHKFNHLKGVTLVGCGAYHSFAANKAQVYSWGLNSFGETGVEDETRKQVDQDTSPVIWNPHIIEALNGKEVICISGGAHHSIAVTRGGECIVWGRVDGHQSGLRIDSIPEGATLKDDKGRVRVLACPTVIPNISAAWAAAGSDHCIVITRDGKAYSWGFSVCYQTGQGESDDIKMAQLIDNKAVRDQEMVWAGAGGQFSVLASSIDRD